MILIQRLAVILQVLIGASIGLAVVECAVYFDLA